MFSPAAHALNLTSWLQLDQLLQGRMQLRELAMTLNLRNGPVGEATWVKPSGLATGGP